MAITPGWCQSYLAELPTGLHTSSDTYKLALYGASATLGASTTAYTASGEVNGSGYTAGGTTLSGFQVVTDGATVLLDWADAIWPLSTITDAAGGLIYNASRSNKAVAVVKFPSPVSSVNGAFEVVWPAPTAATGLLKLARV